MIESAKKHVEILESLDFYDICISLKSSNTLLTIEAYQLASETFPFLYISVLLKLVLNLGERLNQVLELELFCIKESVIRLESL